LGRGRERAVDAREAGGGWGRDGESEVALIDMVDRIEAS